MYTISRLFFVYICFSLKDIQCTSNEIYGYLFVTLLISQNTLRQHLNIDTRVATLFEWAGRDIMNNGNNLKLYSK